MASDSTQARRMGPPMGNQNAKKGKRWIDELRRQLARYEDDECKRGEALSRIARMCVRDAMSPDFEVRHAARTEIANRLDGKPAQRVENTSDQPVMIFEGRIKLIPVLVDAPQQTGVIEHNPVASLPHDDTKVE